jgi:hypothetical protein
MRRRHTWCRPWKLRRLLVRPLELVAEVGERMHVRFVLHPEQQEGEEQRDKTGMHR